MRAVAAAAAGLLTALLAAAAPAQRIDAEPLPENTARIEGRLKAKDGDAAVGVTVLLEISDMRIRRQVAFDRAVSAPDGSFTFDLSRHAEIPKLGLQFNTVSPRYREAVKILTLETATLPATVELELEPGSVARGIVLDESQRPVEGAEVGAPQVRSVVTGADGTFEVFGLNPAGTTYLRATKEGYSDGVAEIISEEPGLVDGLVLRLSPSAELSGIALAPDGSPLAKAGVMLQLQSRFLTAKTDAEGKFELRGVPSDLANCTLKVRSEDHLPIERKFAAGDSPKGPLELKAEWPLAFAGRVTLPGGAPASGVSVTVIHADGKKSFLTDRDGRWSGQPFPPGASFQVIAEPADPAPRSDAGELEFVKNPSGWTANVAPWPKGYRSDFTVEIEGTKLRMVRRDSGEGGIPGDVVYEGTADAAFTELAGTITATATGAKGRFSAKAYQPNGSLRGMWDLRESLGAGEYASAPAMAAVAGAPLSGRQIVDLELAPPGAIEGTVVDAKGDPMGFGMVRVAMWNEQAGILKREAALRAGGRFQLQGIPDGVIEMGVYGEEGELLGSGFGLAGQKDCLIDLSRAEAEDPVE